MSKTKEVTGVVERVAKAATKERAAKILEEARGWKMISPKTLKRAEKKYKHWSKPVKKK